MASLCSFLLQTSSPSIDLSLPRMTKEMAMIENIVSHGTSLRTTHLSGKADGTVPETYECGAMRER